MKHPLHPPHRFRDRDIIQDTEGRIFIALGFIQPNEKVLALPKYLPDSEGKWEKDGQRYRRIFWGGVESVTKGMQVIPKEYLIEDKHFGTTLIEVPLTNITRYFRPENRLQGLLADGSNDQLEETVIKTAKTLHSILDIPLENLGIAGSILWKGHNPEFSDINMNIYGYNHSWLLQNDFEGLADADSHIRIREESEWTNSISRIRERVPVISKDDLQLLFTRRKAFYYDNQCIGITPVLTPPEIPITHLSETYTTLFESPTRIEMDIQNVDFGIFHPGLYEGTSDKIPEIDDNIISRIIVYDGAFTGLLRSGDRVEVSGIFQKVAPSPFNDTEPFYQILVGSKVGAGREYIRLID